MIIKDIIISKKLLKFIDSRWLRKQYIKSCNYIYNWYFDLSDFKLREPKKDKIYYFRINKQFRVYVELEWDILVVRSIDNHQN